MTDSTDIMSLRGFSPWRVIHTQADEAMSRPALAGTVT